MTVPTMRGALEFAQEKCRAELSIESVPRSALRRTQHNLEECLRVDARGRRIDVRRGRRDGRARDEQRGRVRKFLWVLLRGERIIDVELEVSAGGRDAMGAYEQSYSVVRGRIHSRMDDNVLSCSSSKEAKFEHALVEDWDDDSAHLNGLAQTRAFSF